MSAETERLFRELQAYLYDTVPHFFRWAADRLKGKKSK